MSDVVPVVVHILLVIVLAINLWIDWRAWRDREK